MKPASFQRFTPLAFAAVLAFSTAWAVSGPARIHSNWMNFAQDDFFYYLKTAQNFAAGHGSTFGGVTPTNGYHPLWMLFWAAAFRAGMGPSGVPILLAGSIWVSTLLCYWLSYRLLSGSGTGEVISAALGAFVAVYCMHLFATGMEVILAVPAMLAVLLAIQTGWWARGWISSFLLGLLVSGMILSRLDTVIFAALLCAGILLQPAMRRLVHMPHLLGFAAGVLPVAAYLLLNHHFFHVLMPVSGMAKDLKLDHGFTGKAWTAIPELTKSQLFNLTAILTITALLPVFWKKLKPVERVLAPATLLFPVLYFVLLSWMSDWRIWGWYFYVLRPALCVAILVLLCNESVRKAVTWAPLSALIVLAVLLYIGRMKWDTQAPWLIGASIELQDFFATHPGVYAMGDRAGATGYLVSNPMVQTEGLVMDSDFLHLMAAQTPLRDVFARYRVRYYVASAMTPYTGCFEAVEPWQGGPHAPHMRGTFCETPVATWTHEGVKTLVFDLGQQ